ncbi:MAG: undecaprenyl-diphosphate phosphatase [Eubacteriales bacterium]|nr:undecaprenyl-diphosphate phosphatase [Eubacteriales bacterium]
MFFDILKVILIGIVEGITEWLPVSSTGHMILVEDFLKIDNMSENFYPVFLYVIQLGAILAVIFYYFSRLNPFSGKKTDEEKKSTWNLWGKVLIGIIPAGIFGVLLDDWLDEKLIGGGIKCYVVATALIVYGILFIVIERIRKGKSDKFVSVDDISWFTALKIGFFQVLSIIPGTSRSGSTILGGMSLGVSRTASAEFSFFMSIPIMFGVSLLKTGKYAIKSFEGVEGFGVTGNEIILLLIGCIVAFVVSLIAIKFLMDFVKRHSFEVFGWYRIAIGLFVFIYFAVR